MKIVSSILCLMACGAAGTARAENKPLRALLVAGGCCHDYAGQQKVLSEGIQARANIQVDVYWTDDKSVDPPLPLYDNPDWARGYDIVIHDECAAGNKDLRAMKNILKAHETIPAVHLHCAMHSFRNGTDQWFKHLGLQSSAHGPQEPIRIEFVAKDHPITATLRDWTTIREELYNNVNVFDGEAIALGRQIVKFQGKDQEKAAIVAWTNEKQGAPSFSTTIGHNTETVADDRYLEMVTRGVLWACGKLNDDYLGKAFTGQNKVTFVPAKVKKEESATAAGPGPAPKDATLVTVTAQSEETGKSNYAWKAVDGSTDSRWCASDGGLPRWIQLELDQPAKVKGVNIVWESEGSVYGHRIEGSIDGKSWSQLADLASNTKRGDTAAAFKETEVRFLKITCTSASVGSWASIREISLQSPDIKSLFPKLDEKQREGLQKEKEKALDPYAKEGNVPPQIVRLSPEEEAAILRDASVPEGFEMSLFSNSAAANYPVYIAAAPNGDLYVSSDGNGSLGRDPHRGRVLRLRDTDGDGRADQVTEFVKDIDSPRGLIWDHDRLYLLHPPHISVHIDKDGDGVAEESKTLIENIAFGFADRPADHTTNDITLGIDGWIYIAGGDFGYMKARGTDGRELQHRGGGVTRFRPDGSGLELFATGTRNILATPVSPQLDLFARDNTNDGGGWDVRFHHFTGLEDHGYPRMYKNFGEEHIAPLADYGGGSGCGGVYVSEPGFPDEWNNAPFTCDWGTGALWKHTVEPRGSTFQEATGPRKFVKMTRPTDASIDGMSRLYQASWKGATFKWEGPNVGYIVRVSPKGYRPEALPDFEKLSDADLVAALESPSQVRALAAQRTLLRRGPGAETVARLLGLAGNSGKTLASRIAALYAITRSGAENLSKTVAPLADDTDLQRFVLRALGDLPSDEISTGLIAAGLESRAPRAILEAIVAAARRGDLELAPAIASHLGADDPVLAHTAFRALAQLKAGDAAFSVLDDPSSSASRLAGAARALMRMHDSTVVDGVIDRLKKETRPEVRPHLISALSRLYFTEGPWKGDSWGTRPDTRGPYYQPEPWSETPKIAAALRSLLETAEPGEASHLVQEMARNRIQSGDALDRILALAKDNPGVIPEAVAQLAAAGTIPASGIPVLLKALSSQDSPFATQSLAVIALSKTDSSGGALLSLAALDRMDNNVAAMREKLKATGSIADEPKKKAEGKLAGTNLAAAQKQFDSARDAFLKSPKLENHHAAIEKLAAEGDGPDAFWADAALIALAERKSGSPESREMSRKALETAWSNPKRSIRLMKVVAALKNRSHDDRILAAFSSPDPAVASAAKASAKILGVKPSGEDATPKIGTLPPDKAIAMAVQMKGDAGRGEQLFTGAICVACHTATQDEPQKGPYLGNIARTYKRPDLANAILDPNKTIAQGFATNVITMNDGTMTMGFVTDEAGDKVTIRDIAARDHTFAKADIKKRETVPTSMMPPGLLNNFTVWDFASLLDYLEKLSKK